MIGSKKISIIYTYHGSRRGRLRPISRDHSQLNRCILFVNVGFYFVQADEVANVHVNGKTEVYAEEDKDGVRFSAWHRLSNERRDDQQAGSSEPAQQRGIPTVERPSAVEGVKPGD